MEYELIDCIGINEFTKKLNSLIKDNWNPWMNHVIYVDENGKIHYTIMMMKTVPIEKSKS
jgi:hypothetical protein